MRSLGALPNSSEPTNGCTWPPGYQPFKVHPHAMFTNYCDLESGGCAGALGDPMNFTLKIRNHSLHGLNPEQPPNGPITANTRFGATANPPLMIGNSGLGFSFLTGKAVTDQYQGATGLSGICYDVLGPYGNRAIIMAVDRCGGYCRMGCTTPDDINTQFDINPPECGICVATTGLPGPAPAQPCVGVDVSNSVNYRNCSGLLKYGCQDYSLNPQTPVANKAYASCDWCAAQNHPHFDVDTLTFNVLCGVSGFLNSTDGQVGDGSCEALRITPFRCTQPGEFWDPSGTYQPPPVKNTWAAGVGNATCPTDCGGLSPGQYTYKQVNYCCPYHTVFNNHSLATTANWTCDAAHFSCDRVGPHGEVGYEGQSTTPMGTYEGFFCNDCSCPTGMIVDDNNASACKWPCNTTIDPAAVFITTNDTCAAPNQLFTALDTRYNCCCAVGVGNYFYPTLGRCTYTIPPVCGTNNGFVYSINGADECPGEGVPGNTYWSVAAPATNPGVCCCMAESTAVTNPTCSYSGGGGGGGGSGCNLNISHTCGVTPCDDDLASQYMVGSEYCCCNNWHKVFNNHSSTNMADWTCTFLDVCQRFTADGVRALEVPLADAPYHAAFTDSWDTSCACPTATIPDPTNSTKCISACQPQPKNVPGLVYVADCTASGLSLAAGQTIISGGQCCCVSASLWSAGQCVWT